MIRHIVIAAWRNMMANRLISAIAILGLAVGIAAALLMALVVRNQMTFDSFIPGHERTYLAISPGNPAIPGERAMLETDPGMAAMLRLRNPDVEMITRLAEPWKFGNKPYLVKVGNVVHWDSFYWADPNAFDVLPLPVLQGDIATALQRPDGLVLTRLLALKYFGRADAVGQIVTIDGHPMTVRAVLRDLPANGTSLTSGIFASALAPFAKVARDIRDESANSLLVFTYVRLRPGSSTASVEKSAAAFLTAEGPKVTPFVSSHLVRLDRVNLLEEFNPGIHTRLMAAALAGLLVLLTAIVNFVNLSVAVSARRQKEVGVRKSCGASCAALMLQFLGETAIAVMLAGAMALAADEWLTPDLNAFLATGAQFDYSADPLLLPLFLLGAVLVVLAAGGWPALVLSAFRPARVMRGITTAGARTLRNILVTLQFAVLIILAVAAAVVWQQKDYASQAAPGANTNQILIVKTQNGDPCKGPLRDELRRLPGVLAEGCSTSAFLSGEGHFVMPNDNWKPLRGLRMGYAWANPGAFSLYGIRPVAGSFGPLTAHGDLAGASGVILSESAARKLGYASPGAAVGKSWLPGVRDNPVTHRYLEGSNSRIMAVVPDFAFYSVAQPREATVYSPMATATPGGILHLKLDGRRIPETLTAIDRIWKATGQDGPVNRFFLDDYMQQQYVAMTRQAALFAGFTALAILLACLGLFGIAVSTAECRTKEIGVRKAMGADNHQIVALLLWQFAKPVLWANVIAWPVAWWLMRRWLSGFAYHIDLHWWVFAGASAGALLIALATVTGQALITARAKPVLALRTE